MNGTINKYGYPSPGKQIIKANDILTDVFFLSKKDLNYINKTVFDFIVIGTGICGHAFVDRVLSQSPNSRILMIERGPFFLPDHFQNLPSVYRQIHKGNWETFPWALSEKTVKGKYVKWVHGMVPFFAGRSLLWTCWCPIPTSKEMKGWPEYTIKMAIKYFDSAIELLGVIPANKLDSGIKISSFRKNGKLYVV